MQKTILRATEKQEGTETPSCPLLPPVESVDEYAEFAMGWFWGPQRDFDRTEGILETIVGYSGSSDPGNKPNPTYKSIKDCKPFAFQMTTMYREVWYYTGICHPLEL